jgi:2-oxoglutarate ferredoxin oxidoreductase subunit alpha
MTYEAFDLAFRYRNPVLVLGDAMVGQMKEPVVCLPPAPVRKAGNYAPLDNAEAWCLTGHAGRSERLLKSVWLDNNYLSVRVRHLDEKYKSMQREARAEHLHTEDAELVLVAYGSMGRIARALVVNLRKQGKKIGLVRPQTLYPFPTAALQKLAAASKRFLVLEQNTGQMVEDVRLAIQGQARIDWFGVMPGCFPGTDDITEPVMKALGK